MLRSFFARIIDWDWDDAPRRNPVLKGDIPPRPDPLPRFLDDRDAAALMNTARNATDTRARLVTELHARITARVVADEYDAVTRQLDAALYTTLEPTNMARLRRESHARMLGNGLCTRPVELDCRMESACETCAYFATGPEFIPVLLRQ